MVRSRCPNSPRRVHPYLEVLTQRHAPHEPALESPGGWDGWVCPRAGSDSRPFFLIVTGVFRVGGHGRSEKSRGKIDRAVKRGISIQKGRRQTKHDLPIGSADRAAQDLTLSRYKEPAEPLEGRGADCPQGKALVRRRVALRSVRHGRRDAHAPACSETQGLPNRNRRKRHVCAATLEPANLPTLAHFAKRRAHCVTPRALSRDPHVSLAQYTIPDG